MTNKRGNNRKTKHHRPQMEETFANIRRGKMCYSNIKSKRRRRRRRKKTRQKERKKCENIHKQQTM